MPSEYARVPFHQAGSGVSGELTLTAEGDRIEIRLSGPERSVVVVSPIAAAKLIAGLRQASAGLAPEADGSFDDLEAIKVLPPFRHIACPTCGIHLEVHALSIYATCAACRTEVKCRAFGGIGTEIQDVIDAVLAWANVTRAEVRDRQALRRHKSEGAG